MVMVFKAPLTIFSYMVAVSFIGGGNRNNWRKPQPAKVESH